MLTPFGHLTYCTNIHPGENWSDHFQALQDHFPFIRDQFAGERPMGIGLRLSNEASMEILQRDAIDRFRAWLSSQRAYVFTMNGFPYGGFHRTVVKERVHAPDWTRRERVSYTLRLAQILCKLLPEKMDGGISTSPLGYRYDYSMPLALGEARKLATKHILEVAHGLAQIERESGVYIHLDIEPEPDGMLETGAEFIKWYEEELVPEGIVATSSEWNISGAEAEGIIRRHITLCYDICHFAIGYEPHEEILDLLREKGIQIGKFQVSAALRASLPEEAGMRGPIADAFNGFNESVYLHQVVARRNDHTLIRYRDLPPALADINNPEVTEWRSHYHVPISTARYGLLHSTQDDIRRVLQYHVHSACTSHLEVETYTWDVLPAGLKLPLAESVVRELQWLERTLQSFTQDA